MKAALMAIALISVVACGSGNGSGSAADTSVNPGAAGNSDGINTTGIDTAHLDTTLGRIRTDSAR